MLKKRNRFLCIMYVLFLFSAFFRCLCTFRRLRSLKMSALSWIERKFILSIKQIIILAIFFFRLFQNSYSPHTVLKSQCPCCPISCIPSRSSFLLLSSLLTLFFLQFPFWFRTQPSIPRPCLFKITRFPAVFS